jgi:hypothetical protein
MHGEGGRGEAEARAYGQSLGTGLSISLGRYATVFQAEINAILTCAYKIQMNAKPEKYISICSDSQASWKTLQSAKTMSPLVQWFQKAVNDISTHHFAGFLGPRTFWDMWKRNCQ